MHCRRVDSSCSQLRRLRRRNDLRSEQPAQRLRLPEYHLRRERVRVEDSAAAVSIDCPLSCGAGSFCNGSNQCQSCNSVDLPDDEFTDVNCDGLDGMADAGVFVAPSGNDSSAGTRAAPLRTLGGAIAKAKSLGLPFVFVATSTYLPAAPLVWDAPVSLIGGYGGPGAGWTRDGGIFTISTSCEGVRVVTSGALTFEAVQIVAADASVGCGASVALTSQGSRLFLHHVRLASGQGSNGAPGDAGGAPGASGADGGNGVQPRTSSNWGDGGLGGTSSCGAAGAMGGVGGFGYSTQPHEGDPGETVSGGAPGGPGGARGGCDLPFGCTCDSLNSTPAGFGSSGQPGQSGSNGLSGAGGDPYGRLLNGVWVASFGSPGADGGAGQPGGGGGGGGAWLPKNPGGFCTFTMPGGEEQGQERGAAEDAGGREVRVAVRPSRSSSPEAPSPWMTWL